MGSQTGIQKKESSDRAYQPSDISLTRTQTPLSGRALETLKELKRQDMNSYLYLLMEDMLFATVKGLSKEQGDMTEIVAGYLVEFYKRELNVKNDVNPAAVKT